MSKKNKPSKSPKKAGNKSHDSSALPGWPGYRTREGRSGYDPIDTRTEAAHTAGTIIQTLVSGRIRNPIFLFLLGVLGLVLSSPLVLAILGIVNGNQLPWNAWLFLLITAICGLAILTNFIRNLLRIFGRPK